MKKLLALSLTLFILAIGVVAYAEETTTTSTTTTTAPVVTTEAPTVVPPVTPPVSQEETVAKDVYMAREGYIVSFDSNQLILSKDKVFTLTLITSTATKVFGVGNKKGATVADLKAGQKVLVRFTVADKKAISVKILPGKAPKAIKERIKAKAAEIAKLKARQKVQKAKIEAARTQIKLEREKVKELREKQREEAQEKIKEIRENAKEQIKELRQKGRIRE
jgi:hypothetical protein